MKESTCTPELLLVVNEIGKANTQFTAHFNSSRDLLCCSALARAMAPVAVRPMSLRLQWNMYRLLNEVEISIGYAQLIGLQT